jgi:hypothetical protein
MTEQSETEIKPFDVNDEITIMRGLYKGQTGTVVYVDHVSEAYAVRLPDGGMAAPINWVNVKPPVEATITATLLAEVFNRFVGDVPDGLLAALENVAPGITAHVKVAEASA